MKLHNPSVILVARIASLSLSAAAQQDGPAVRGQAAAAGRAGAAAANGKPDFSGHWLPNGAGQGVSGRFGVDPAARGPFDPKVTPELPPAFQPWASGEDQVDDAGWKRELARSSVNCMPRGLPAIWLQNPYSTVIVHTPTMMAQLLRC